MRKETKQIYGEEQWKWSNRVGVFNWMRKLVFLDCDKDHKNDLQKWTEEIKMNQQQTNYACWATIYKIN